MLIIGYFSVIKLMEFVQNKISQIELFRLLKLPKGTSLEKLTFNDLLRVQQQIVNNIEALKNL